jgi:hypothetical protein
MADRRRAPWPDKVALLSPNTKIPKTPRTPQIPRSKSER